MEMEMIIAYPWSNRNTIAFICSNASSIDAEKLGNCFGE
uniref:Uncharacterized protein n=1 Tax=Arundo donax TaxID=35708 RepID=A0A0A8Z8S0_ARUDO